MSDLKEVLKKMKVNELIEEIKKFNAKQQKKIIMISQSKDALIEEMVSRYDDFKHLVNVKTKMEGTYSGKMNDAQTAKQQTEEQKQILFFTNQKIKTFRELAVNIRESPNNESLKLETARKWEQLSASMKNRIKTKAPKLYDFMTTLMEERTKLKTKVKEQNLKEKEQIIENIKKTRKENPEYEKEVEKSESKKSKNK